MTGRESRALEGRRLLVLVPEGRGRELIDGLEQLGATVYSDSVTRTRALAPEELECVDAWLRGDEPADWIVLSSAEGVRRLVERGVQLGIDLPARWSDGPTHVAVIGPATARALAEAGRPADLVADDPRSEGLAARLLEFQPGGLVGQSILVVRAEEGRPELIETLAAAGARVRLAPIYRTAMIEGAAERLAGRLRSEDPPIDLLVVTSGAPLTVLAGVLPTGERGRVPLAVLGPVTAEVARNLGFTVVATGRGGRLERLIEAVIIHYETTR